MPLYERLAGTGGSKIAVHEFMAAVGEVERGKQSEATLAAWFTLDAGEQAELTTLAARVKTPVESYPLAGRVTLTNVGTAYDANADSQGLPFVWFQRAGVTRMEAEVRVRKAAAQTGVLDFQFWDETNGVSALDSANATTGSLTDSAAAGDHTLTASRTFPSALSPQFVKVRLRAKSSVAGDDPTFLAASLLLFRVDKLTAVELHELLLLAEARRITVAALKTRLGVS
jgi:hypothetical protein